MLMLASALSGRLSAAIRASSPLLPRVSPEIVASAKLCVNRCGVVVTVTPVPVETTAAEGEPPVPNDCVSTGVTVCEAVALAQNDRVTLRPENARTPSIFCSTWLVVAPVPAVVHA